MPFAVGMRRAVTPRASHDAGTPAPITSARSRVALVDEHRAQRVHEDAADPRVRHVADELRRLRVAVRDLRPLVPAGRAAVGDDPVEQPVRVVAPAELDERLDVPQLVRRVRDPVLSSRRAAVATSSR